MSTSTALRRAFPAVSIALSGVMLSGCQAIADIFKAGVWVGAIAVIVVIALVIFLVAKVGRSS
jgi:hypothetical protein